MPTRLRGGFTINGRFLSQRTTGVQRYAGETVLALDAALASSGVRATLLAPRERKSRPNFVALDVRETALSGHAWEQLALPLRAEGPIVNLCNLAPLGVSRQVVCIHDANVFLAPESYSRSFVAYYRALLPWIARRAIEIATVSKASAAALADRLGVPLQRFSVAPNGHEHTLRWDATRSTLTAELQSSRPYVVAIGSAARHKNIGLVLGLAEHLDTLGLDLRIVGGSASIFAQGDERTSVRAPNMHVHAKASDDDLAALLAGALCLAFPSLVEGFGLPMLEAMALGCPVVASDIEVAREVCADAAIYADPRDRSAWAAAFSSLARSTALAERLGEAGRERARRYSWAETAHVYGDILARL